MNKNLFDKDIKNNPYRMFGIYRALLAFMVVISHASGWLPEIVSRFSLGNVGVFSFFILSGFVVAEASDIFYSGKPIRFLLNRAIKIFPTYWASCLLAIMIYSWFDMPELNLSTYSIFANFSILLAERLPSNEFRLNSMVWAVGIELRFYALAALIAYIDGWVSKRNINYSNKVFYLAAIIFLSLYVYSFMNNFEIISTIKYSPFFLLGYNLYLLKKYKNTEAIFVGILTIFASLHSYVHYNSLGLNVDVKYTTLLFILSILILYFLSSINCKFKKLNVFDKVLGEITYSTYLVHGSIIYAVSKSNFSAYTSFIITIVLTLISSILIHIFLERKLVKIRNSIRMRSL